ncbi:MAG: hypothetical protein KF732_10195 [Flavobacteriales bacterium]|nr:hypothetical protein [Flavobacteriales bacterium]
MKLIKTSDKRLMLFEAKLFMSYLMEITKANPHKNISPLMVLVPVIQCEKPRLIKGNEYEVTVHNLMSADDNNTDKEKVIVHTRCTFRFSHDEGMSKKDLFKLILDKTDENNSQNFYSYIETMKTKARSEFPELLKLIGECEYLILKLGTNYRPYPTFDYDNFFRV